MNPTYYPNVNWVKEGMRDFSENNQVNLMMRGGVKSAVTWHCWIIRMNLGF